jgi:hypothetical protein
MSENKSKILPNGTTVLRGETDVQAARLLVLKSALKLEIKGLGRRGRSAYSIIKGEFGLRGNKQKVLEQFEKLLREKGILIDG